MDFTTAAEKVKELPSCSDKDKLSLYALYKQATVGDVNTATPGMLDFREKAKWDAWSEKKGMPKVEAETAYVQKATELLKKAGLLN